MGFPITSDETGAVWIRTQVATNCIWASIRDAYRVKNCSGKVDDNEEAYNMKSVKTFEGLYIHVQTFINKMAWCSKELVSERSSTILPMKLVDWEISICDAEICIKDINQ